MFALNKVDFINTFKYHVLWTDGKISVRINLLFYLLFSTVVPSNICMFLSCRPFNTTFSTGLMGVEVTSASWLGQLTVGNNFSHRNNWPSNESILCSVFYSIRLISYFLPPVHRLSVFINTELSDFRNELNFCENRLANLYVGKSVLLTSYALMTI